MIRFVAELRIPWN